MGHGGSVEQAGTHLGKSVDNGIDGVINEDKLGLNLIYILAKRHVPDNPIGRSEIQKFAGIIISMSAKKGVFITTSTFSSHMFEYARNVPHRVALADGEKLTALKLEHNIVVRINQTTDLKRIMKIAFWNNKNNIINLP